jgi:hypothetical protein
MRLKGIFPLSYEELSRALSFLLAWFLCSFFDEFCDELRFTSAFTHGMLRDVLHRWDRRQIEVLADAARTGE